MPSPRKFMLLVLAGLCVLPVPLAANEADYTGPRADTHAPTGVMRNHTHGKGECMLSYRFMHMDMGGDRIGTDEVTPEQIVTTVPNIFAGPPTLRIVPTDMRMDMYMFGVMYAPSNHLALMVMGSYVFKEMDNVTFQGPAGTTRLGTFTTHSEGFGDPQVSAMIPLLHNAPHALQLNAGVSVPVGAIENTGQILTPLNTRPTVRLPYPMQIGSGTFDALPGLTTRDTGNRSAGERNIQEPCISARPMRVMRWEARAFLQPVRAGSGAPGSARQCV